MMTSCRPIGIWIFLGFASLLAFRMFSQIGRFLREKCAKYLQLFNP
jgi:hypothetical protein